jgi:hypothetical protein
MIPSDTDRIFEELLGMAEDAMVVIEGYRQLLISQSNLTRQQIEEIERLALADSDLAIPVRQLFAETRRNIRERGIERAALAALVQYANSRKPPQDN